MSKAAATLLVGAALAACQPSQPRDAAQLAPSAAPAAPAAPAPPAPPFRPGIAVVDRTGARVGTVQSVTETPGGPNVVITIDGKLVGIPPATLKLEGEAAVSSQTKAEMLASAGAPP